MYKFIVIALALIGASSCSASRYAQTDKSPKQVTSAFMHDLFTSDHDLLRDENFKKKYFSTALRDRIKTSLSQYHTYQPPKEAPYATHPAYPDEWNKTIFMAWDLPTSYKVKSQHITGNRATVDVIFLWGPGTQYAGDRRHISAILIKESDSWYINDLFTHKGEFVPDTSLYESLLK